MKEISLMYQKVTLVLVFIIIAMASEAQKNVLGALWKDSAVTIDGNPVDWDQPFRYYDSKAKIQYSVVNDTHDLYICLKTMDDKAQMKMLRPGMEVSVDPSGKKKETCAIRYPLPNDTKLEWVQDGNEPEQQHLERPDLKRLKLDYSVADKKMKLTGFKNIPGDIMSVENKYGIQVAIGWDKDDVLTYEIKIPFSTFYKESLSAVDTLKPIIIGVKINGFDVPQQISNGSIADPRYPTQGCVIRVMVIKCSSRVMVWARVVKNMTMTMGLDQRNVGPSDGSDAYETGI
jgi:hypothetical protein